MWLRKWLRDLIIGESNFIESRGLFKQVMLSGQFALMGIVICILYLTVDLLEDTYSTFPVYFINLIFLSMSIYIHRQGRHCLANYFLLPTMNITVYLITASESAESGGFIFFIPVALSAFAVFNYNQRLLSLLFATFTYVLFALAYFVDFSILPERRYDDDLILLNVVVNFSMALPASLMTIYLLITLNHDNALQVEQNNRLLVKTNAELDRFVYSTSHDLRAPLASVLGLINIADRSNDPTEVKRYVGMMRDRVHSLDKFIRDITDYSRNNRQTVTNENIRLASLAEEIWDSLKYAEEAANIGFHQEIPESVEVRGDRNRIRIILSNLMSNAIRYHDDSKPEKYIKLKYDVNGKGYYVKVEDNGLGISREYHEKVFTMFFRANEKSKGTGLGLYIVQETLAKLSGTVQLDSQPGRGSTFTIKLPK
jgi:signal transduction histidine kinase